MKIICVEEHFSDKAIAQATQKTLVQLAPYITRSLLPGMPAAPAPGSLEDVGGKRIADMDANGIDMQILSASNSTQLLSSSEAVSMAAAANDKIADAIKSYPNRFAAFATLPMSDPQGAAAELERAITQLNFKGAMLAGRPAAEAVFLDDPKYSAVLEMASKLKVPIYVHPGFPLKTVTDAYYERLDPIVSARLSVFGWGWHAEAGVHILRLILSGAFDKYPCLQIIAGHWGEMVPFFLARLDETIPKEITHLQKTITEYFTEHVYVTPSGMFTIPHFLFMLHIMGADRIIYSVDYPYIRNENARAFLENAPICQADKEKIAHGNAERLFNL